MNNVRSKPRFNYESPITLINTTLHINFNYLNYMQHSYQNHYLDVSLHPPLRNLYTPSLPDNLRLCRSKRFAKFSPIFSVTLSFCFSVPRNVPPLHLSVTITFPTRSRGRCSAEDARWTYRGGRVFVVTKGASDTDRFEAATEGSAFFRAQRASPQRLDPSLASCESLRGRFVAVNRQRRPSEV